MSNIINYQIRPTLDQAQMNALFGAAWPRHEATDFSYVANHSLLWVCAYYDGQLVGFVNMAWDGGVHGFLLDTTVHPDFQRRGIGVQLVQVAVGAAKAHGIEWIHVDYEPRLDEFYRQCGFRPTAAAIINLRQ